MAEVSPLIRRPTISRQAGPTYVNTYALKGLRVYYRPPIPLPDPVTLPVGWNMPRLSDDHFRVDLTKERQVLEQANLRRQAIAGEVTSPHDSLRGNIFPVPGAASSGIPLIPYQSSSILTPVPVSSSQDSNNSHLDKPLGEMSLRDFEGESDPFEATALQAIDVFSELQSVLQPTASPPIDVPRTSNPSVSVQPPSHLSQSPPAPSSQSVYSPPTANEEFRRRSLGLLVDVGGLSHQHEYPTPGPSTQPIAPPQYTPIATVAPITAAAPSSNTVPPPVPPKPKPRTSPNPTHRPFLGVAVLPPIGQQPPPYSSEPNSYAASYDRQSEPAPAPRGYSLPDIRDSLSLEEKENLKSISNMGFPATRVARVLKHFESDNQKVFDFLLQVGEIEEKGYGGDSGETALLAHEQDVQKSLDYLNQVYQYKEVWPEEKIHKAYQQAGGNWDETVDILTQGR